MRTRIPPACAAFSVVLVPVAILLAGAFSDAASQGAWRPGAGPIRSIEPGMTEFEVSRILGKPRAIERNGKERICRVVDGVCSYTGPDGHDLLTYTTHAFANRPAVFVHLQEGRVTEVYAKRSVDWSWGLDDEGAYLSTVDGVWESPRFASTFAP
jgi:hypothetical protein